MRWGMRHESSQPQIFACGVPRNTLVEEIRPWAAGGTSCTVSNNNRSKLRSFEVLILCRTSCKWCTALAMSNATWSLSSHEHNKVTSGPPCRHIDKVSEKQMKNLSDVVTSVDYNSMLYNTRAQSFIQNDPDVMKCRRSHDSTDVGM